MGGPHPLLWKTHGVAPSKKASNADTHQPRLPRGIVVFGGLTVVQQETRPRARLGASPEPTFSRPVPTAARSCKRWHDRIPCAPNVDRRASTLFFSPKSPSFLASDASYVRPNSASCQQPREYDEPRVCAILVASLASFSSRCRSGGGIGFHELDDLNIRGDSRSCHHGGTSILMFSTARSSITPA